MKYSKIFFNFSSLSLMALSLINFSTPAFANLSNGGFESNLIGWEVIQGNVEILSSSNFNTPIPAPEGSYFVLITNGPSDSPAPDNSPYSDKDSNGEPENDETILRRSFDLTNDGQLCYEWSWLTSEEQYVSPYDDIFYVLLDGNIIHSGTVDHNPNSSPFPKIPTDNENYSVTSTGSSNGADFESGRSPWQTFCTSVSAGSHVIEFVVADQGDHSVDSGLLIDNVTISSNPMNNLPIINSFTLSPSSGYAPFTTSFSWNVSDPDGDTLTCYLDIDDDGNNDYIINDCANNTSQSHTYSTAGNYIAKLIVDDGNGGTATDTVNITVNPPETNNVEINPSLLNFGEFYVGNDSDNETITVKNNSDSPVYIVNVALRGVYANNFRIISQNCSHLTLNPGNSCNIVVDFKPQTVGKIKAVVKVVYYTEDTEYQKLYTKVRGVGRSIQEPNISSSETVKYFEADVENCETQTVTIINAGGDNPIGLKLTKVMLRGKDSAEFQITNDNCTGQTLLAGGTCNVQVKFCPTTAGKKKAVLKIKSNDPNDNPYRIKLRGNYPQK